MTKTRTQKMFKCRCTSRQGVKKKRYPTRQNAVNIAILRGWVPNTYPCPSGKGFHLTHGE